VPISKRQHCALRLVFGVATNSALAKATHDLKDFNAKLKKMKFKQTDIRLFTKALFHTKLYYFLNGTAPTWFVGSANASSAIEGDRHELMIRLTGRHDALFNYVRAVNDAAVPVGENPKLPRGPAREMRSFFLNGSLCYRPAALALSRPPVAG
jgi:NgoFVII-like restriction endonuclease